MASVSKLFPKTADALRASPNGGSGRTSRWGPVRRIGLKLALFSAVMFIVMVGVGHAGDPTGGNTGTAADVLAKVAGKPTATEVAQDLGHVKVSLNLFFLIFGAALVFFMQSGFALVETGFCRAKNAVHVIMTNFVIFFIGTLVYWAVGFGLQFGGFGSLVTFGGTQALGHSVAIGGWGLFGTQGFFLSGGNYDVAIFGFFMFQLVFMDTAATIVTGAMAERWKFSAFIVFGIFMAAITYPIYGGWVWGGGWLAALGKNWGLGHGALDFAGSGVVHAVGGFSALAGAAVLGPRIGKFNKDGTPNAIPAHHIPMAILGAILLVFGWIGFNGASTLAATDMRFSVIVVNTFLAGSAGGLAAMFLVWKMWGKPDPSMTANGLLAGLVAITAPCAFVNSWAAVVIGTVAGFLVVGAMLLVERVFKVDDPVGAVAVHGFNGLWGLLALGIFADGTYGAGFNGVAGGVTGLLYGDAGQFLAQLIDVVVVVVWAFGLMYAFFKIQDRIMGIRVSREFELEGLDTTEMGISAYPDFRVGGNIGEGVFHHGPEGHIGTPLVPPPPQGAPAQ
jgi:Amt family ammonium transporter